MAKSKTNWNQLMLEKGDRIGLAVAVVLGALLLFTSLFWPGSGLLATSPTTNANELAKKAEDVERKLVSNTPQPNELPAKKAEDVKPPDFVKNEITDEQKPGLEVLPIVPPAVVVSNTRRQPHLLLPDEGRVEVLMSQIKSYIFKYDDQGRPTHVVVFKDAFNKEGPGAKQPPGMGGGQDLKSFYQRMGRGQQAGGMPSMMPRMSDNTRFQMPQTGKMAPEEGVRKETHLVKLTDLAEAPNSKLVETVRPLRMAEIVASFPLRQQLDEYRDKLRLATYNAVLHEPSMEMNETTRMPLNSFRFMGVRVQRRAVDATGKPLAGKAGAWEDINLEATFKPYVILAGKRTQPDKSDLDPILVEGLVMPRLLQAQDNQYPDIETKLTTIDKTLAELKAANPDQKFTPPSQFNEDSFNIFGKTGGAEHQANQPFTGPMTAPPGMPKRGSGVPPMPNTGAQPYNPNDPTGMAGDVKPPEHCLIRLIDVTIKPGTIYQYRLRARLANPNFKRTDVASPKYAEEPELEADKEKLAEDKNWFLIPQNVIVPPEMVYYTVDQKEVDGASSYKGIHARDPIDKKNQVAFQIHAWLENVDSTSRTLVPVGEWAVAERLIVNRGEPIDRKAKVEVPLWVENMDTFVIASSGNLRQKTPGIDVDFSHHNNKAILVDFEGGPEHSYQRTGAPLVKEDKGTTTEVLILSPDGKLVAHDTDSDRNSQERKDRLEAYRKRIKEVKEPKHGADTGKPMNPFGTKN
jgi:hypothetical protein